MKFLQAGVQRAEARRDFPQVAGARPSGNFLRRSRDVLSAIQRLPGATHGLNVYHIIFFFITMNSSKLLRFFLVVSVVFPNE